MRRLPLRIANKDPLSLQFDDVSLIVTAAGYEPRSTHLMERLARHWGRPLEALGPKTLLLEYASFHDLPSRARVDQFFAVVQPGRRLSVRKDSGLEVLKEVSARSKSSGTIIVDYSCMSRLLYLSLVPLVYDGKSTIFSYSVGRYSAAAEVQYPIAAVGDIGPVPGLEGVHYHSRPTLHVFGLGYDGTGTQALADKLEASRIVAFWADPGAGPHSAEIAKKQNELLIQRSLAYFARDLRDVHGTVSVLSRLAFESIASDKVVFVPVGPKPHVLACALAAAPHEHCAVLAPYLGKGGIRDDVPIVEASGELIGVLAQVPQPRS